MSAQHFRTESEVPRKKLVAVGDHRVGKTRMFARLHSDEFHEYFLPTIFENHIEDLHVDGNLTQIVLWDISSSEEYNPLRRLSYPGTHVFLICFSVDNPSSFENVEVKWVPEVLHFRPNTRVPYLLVGCRSDLRRDKETIEALRQAGLSFVTSKKAESLAESIGAVMYLECSALTGEGVSEVFEHAMRAALLSQKPKKREPCIIF
ncbi:GTP-binding protein Rho1 [Serendipita sp. 405]|nr:GTP-binding protein Rho1 [Serendipita sp. 397]KAG8774903.1 GTP-binding protein Rho1 [Serendipita sp. 398]KAG8841173.1 GTP-binding protein Rho1 [Serendipita sp. 405]